MSDNRVYIYACNSILVDRGIILQEISEDDDHLTRHRREEGVDVIDDVES